MKYSTGFAIILAMLLLFVSASTTSDNDVIAVTDPVQQQRNSVPSYDVHSPIQIDNNTHFGDLATSEGWSGNGSSSDPYVISGYSITSNIDDCIYIQYVTVYFEIRNCYFSGGMPTDGVLLDYCQNGLIENCTIVNKNNGIRIDNSNNILVNNCSVSDCGGSTILARWSDTIDVIDCHVWDSNRGVYIVATDHADVVDCTIEDFSNEGVYIQGADFCTLSHTMVTNSGGGYDEAAIRLLSSHDATIFNVTSFNNPDADVSGIHAVDSDRCDVSESRFHNSEYNGIHFENCDDATIDSVNCTNNGDNGLMLEMSTGAIIEDCIFSINGRYGLYVGLCSDSTFRYNDIFGNDQDGIYTHESQWLNLVGNSIFENGWEDIINHPGSGVDMQYTHNSSIESCTIYNNSAHGIDIAVSLHCNVTGNTIYDNQDYVSINCGVYMWNSNETRIDDNTIYNNVGNGITSRYSHDCIALANHIYNNSEKAMNIRNGNNWIIHGNTIWNHSVSGIDLESCVDFSINNNEFHDNFWSMYASTSNDCNFTNNLIYEGESTGVNLQGCLGWLLTHNIIVDGVWAIALVHTNSTSIYYNEFGFATEHGMEWQTDGSNLWDNNVSMGNWYVEYDLLSGPVPIMNDSVHVVNYDRYPMSAMWIEGEYIVTYELATTGNEFEFGAFARNPSHYEIYIDSELHDTQAWDGTNITVNIDGLSVDLHGIEVLAYHSLGNYIYASGGIDVEDTTAPTWVTIPENQIISYGTPLSYQLQATDPSGIETWRVYDDGFSITNGLLTNATVLEVGEYTITIMVRDIYDNELGVTLTITVIAQGPPPIDYVTMLFVIGGIGAAAAVVVVIVLIKRKPSG